MTRTEGRRDCRDHKAKRVTPSARGNDNGEQVEEEKDAVCAIRQSNQNRKPGQISPYETLQDRDARN